MPESPASWGGGGSRVGGDATAGAIGWADEYDDVGGLGGGSMELLGDPVALTT